MYQLAITVLECIVVFAYAILFWWVLIRPITKRRHAQQLLALQLQYEQRLEQERATTEHLRCVLDETQIRFMVKVMEDIFLTNALASSLDSTYNVMLRAMVRRDAGDDVMAMNEVAFYLRGKFDNAILDEEIARVRTQMETAGEIAIEIPNVDVEHPVSSPPALPEHTANPN